MTTFYLGVKKSLNNAKPKINGKIKKCIMQQLQLLYLYEKFHNGHTLIWENNNFFKFYL